MDNLDHQSARITRNPHPVQRYELTFTLHDAPGPFDAVTASAAYEIANKECVPRQPVSGANPAPAPVIPIDVERVGDNTYRGYVYLDLLKDEDLYGLGVCHWTLASAGPEMEVNGVSFGAGSFKEDVQAQRGSSTYFAKQSFSEKPRYRDPGTYDRYLNSYQKEHLDDYFRLDMRFRDAR